jgi:enoyl-CoA hydratase
MEHILYEAREQIALITLNRPDRRNAQNQEFLEQLDRAWTKAADAKDVKVIILKSTGPHFSAGHDLTQDEVNARTMESTLGDIKNTGMMNLHTWEAKHYLGFSRKWRDIPKPSIAAVQGSCIAGGLLLCWPCDLIIAADNAKFSDPVVRMGIGGVEYHGHTWEFGARKAKEMLFTAGHIDAQQAERLGMVNRVVPLDQLHDETWKLAQQIAQMHPFALAMAKRAVNQTLDVMGQQTALQSCFDIHQLGHASAYAQSGQVILTGLEGMKKKG